MLNHSTVLALVAVDALGVLGVIVWRLQGRQRPTARLVVQIAFFTAMTTAMVSSGIMPYRAYGAGAGAAGGSFLGASALVLWWVHLAWAAIGFVRLYIVLDRRPQEARLFQDLIVAAVYLGVTLSIVGLVFGAPIGTLIATSGVVAIIFGLALQNTLGDLFSGVALTLGRPFSIGDWIQLGDGTEGRVVENSWRSTHVLTPAHNIVVLPNSALAKVGLTNLTRPDETHLIVLPLRIAATQRPSLVQETILTALQTCQCIVQNPVPIVALKSVDAIAIEIELLFRVTSPAQRTPARNEVIDAVYQQCAANGLAFAPPPQSLIHWVAGDPGDQTAPSGAQRLSRTL